MPIHKRRIVISSRAEKFFLPRIQSASDTTSKNLRTNFRFEPVSVGCLQTRTSPLAFSPLKHPRSCPGFHLAARQLTKRSRRIRALGDPASQSANRFRARCTHSSRPDHTSGTPGSSRHGACSRDNPPCHLHSALYTKDTDISRSMDSGCRTSPARREQQYQRRISKLHAPFTRGWSMLARSIHLSGVDSRHM